jgi:hypothetical protein
MNKAAIFLLLGTLLVSPLMRVRAYGAERDAVAQATTASDNWLHLVDEGKYRASYNDASALLKDRVPQARFVDEVAAARKPLGAVISRKVESAQYATSLPGAPDGQYVVIRYRTSFSNKKSATETVTPMMDKDGHWRVSGYYIK